MDKIVAIIPFYNDFKALQRLLLSISSMNIPSIFCDGRFHDFKKINDSDFSTDGSRFLTLGFKKTKLIDCGPCYIEEKINKLFHEASKLGYSHTLLIGCDEYLKGDLKLLQQNLKNFDQKEPMIIRMPFQEHSTNEKLNRKDLFIERIFFMPGLIRARGSHRLFYSAIDQAKGKKQSMQSSPSTISSVTLHHDNTIRTKDRNELMLEYQNKIKEFKI